MVTSPTLRLDTGSDTGQSASDRVTAISRPGFTGSADPGAVVRLFADGTLVGQTTADPSGKYLLLPTVSLGDGSRSMTATATLSGVVSTASAPLVIMVDTVRPINTTIALSLVSDTAAIGDLVTADLTPTLSGKAESGAQVTILRDGTVIGQTIAVNGEWTFTPTVNQPEGFRKFSAVTTDLAGNTELVAPVVSLLLDATAPPPPAFGLAVASDSGRLGDLATNVVRPTLTGTGEDGSFLGILEGDTLIGRATVTGGVWSTTLTGALSEGAHLIRVINGDVAGNRSETQQTIVIDTSTVTPVITLAAPSDSGAPGDGLTRVKTPFLTGTAEAGSVVSIRDGGTEIATATAGADGSWTVQTPVLSEGSHTLTAQARDVAGNLSAISAPLAVTIDSIAPAAPSVFLAAASDSGLAGDNRTNDQTLTLTGTAEAGATVVISVGLAELGRVTASASGAWQFDDATVRPNGSVTYLVQQIDRAGNASAVTSFSPVIDLLAPAAPRVFLAPGSDTGSSSSDRITADAAPRFTGISEANATILLSIDGSPRGSVIADGAGNWSFQSPLLADGAHVLAARAVDVAGNTGPATEIALTVDRAAPVAPVLRLDAASDSGRSATDRVTAVSTPSLSGQAEANARVDLFDGGVQIGSVLADAAGAFRFTPASALGDGTHVLSARATDAAGNGGPATTLSIVIDTRPETVAIDLLATSDTGRSATDDITADTTPTLDFGATTGLTAGDVITVRMDGAIVGTITFDPAQPFTFTPAAAVANGTHVFSAVHTDLAGNVSAAGTLAVTVDTVKPSTPTIGLDPASDTGRSATDRLTADATPTFAGTAEAGATIVLTRSGVEVGRGLADAAGKWSVTTTVLPEGASTIATAATDAAGNTGTSASLQITLDTVAPLAPTLDLLTDSGRLAGDDRTNATTLTFAGTAEAGSEVSLFDGTTLLGTAITNARGAYSLTITAPLSEGSHAIDAIATDAAGNASPATRLPIVIDRTGPEAPVFSLAAASDSGRFANDRITSQTTLLFTGTSEPGAVIEIFSGSTRLSLIDPSTGLTVTSVIAAADGSWSARNAVAFAGSTLSLSARATDVAGNAGGSTPLAVVIDRAAPAAPVLRLDASSDTGISQSDRLTADATPTLSGTAEANALVIVLQNGAEIARGIADAGGIWTATPSLPLASGLNTLTATATDLAGNVSAASAPLTFEIDVTAPAAPSIRLDAASDTGISAADNLTADTTPTVSGTAEANARVEIRDGNALLGTATANAAGAWTFTAPVLADGRHTLTARAIDAAGNVSIGTAVTVTVDSTAPAAPSLDLAANSDSGRSNTDNLTNARVAVLQGVTEPGASVTIRSGTTVIGSTLANAVDGTWSFPVANLPEGIASFTVTATDLSGNTGPQSSALLVTVDRTAPVLAAALSASSDSGRSASDRITSDTTPTLSGQSEAGAEIFFSLPGQAAGTPLPSVTADTGGNWSFTPSVALAQGLQSIGITAVDAAGNASAATTLAIEIDTAAPATSIGLAGGSDTGISSTDRLTKAKTPVITGVTDAGARVSVTVASGGTSQVFTVTAGADGAWSVTPADLADGVVTATARAEDVAGNTGPAGTLTFTVDTRIGTPVLALASSSDTKSAFVTGGTAASDGVTFDKTPTFLVGNASLGDSVVFLDNGVEIFRTTAGAAVALGQGLPTGATITLPELGDGVHPISVRLEDAAGNVSAVSGISRLLIDTVAPSAPSVPDLIAASDTGLSDSDNLTQIRTPGFAGTAEPGSLVVISLDGTVVGQQAASATDGAWSFRPSAALADGAHVLSVRAADLAGNLGAASSLGFTIDGTAPIAPTLDLAAFSDSGRSSTDNVTALQNLRMTGTAEAGSTVEVLDGLDVVTSAIVLADGTWSATLQAQAERTHAYTARATDKAGNRSASSPALPVTVDLTGPATTITLDPTSDTGISSTDLLTSVRTLTFRGKTEAGALVTLLRGSTTVGTVTADSAGSWTFAAAAPEGLGGYSAFATDSAGNTGPRSDALQITVDRTPPPLTLAIQAGDDTGRSPTDTVTAKPMPTLVILTEANTTLDVRFDNDVVSRFVTTTAIVTAAKSLPDGIHSLFVTARDAAGNATSEQRLTFTIDTAAPAAPTIDLAAASDTGRSSTDDITRDNTPTFTGTAEAGATVELLVGGTVVGTATASSSGVWTATLSALADGRVTVTARSVDAAGNQGAAASLAITVDTVAPTALQVSLDGMSDTGAPGDNLTADITPVFTVGAAFNPTDRVRVTATPHGGTAQLLSDQTGTPEQTLTLAAQPNGTTVVTVTSEDIAGNVSTATKSVRIDGTTPSGPTIQLNASSDTGFSSADRVTKDNTPTFSGAARPGSTVTVKANGRVLGTAVTNATSTWSFTPGALADGTYLVEAFDGTAGTQSTTITVDTVAPVAPGNLRLASSIDAGFLGDFVSTSEKPVFEVDMVSDAVSYQLLVNGNMVSSLIVLGQPGKIVLTPFDALATGDQISVRAFDLAGNLSSESVARTLRIDTRALALDPASDTGTVGDNITADDTPTIVTTAAPGETVRFSSLQLGNIGSAVADANGVVRFTPSVALSQGSYGIFASGAGGGSIAGGAVLSLTIDKSGPQPVKILLSALSDTGTALDRVTADTAPTLTLISSSDVVSIEIRDGSTVIGTVSALGTNRFTTFTPALPLSAGLHSLTAIGIDAAGNRSAVTFDSTLSLTVETAGATAPTISSTTARPLTALLPFDLYAPAGPIALSGSGRPGALIEILDGATVIGSVTANSRGDWSFVTPPQASGSHGFTARDGTAQSRPLVIDVAPVPFIPFTMALAADSDAGVKGDNRTSSATILSGNFVLEGTASPYASVVVRVLTAQPSQTIGSVTVLADEYGKWTARPEITGRLSTDLLVVGTATGALGNGQVQLAVTLNASDGVSVNAGATNTVFSGLATAGNTVVVSVDGREVGRAVAGTTGSWSLSVVSGSLGEGRHAVRALTPSGDLISPLAQTTFTVDTIAPAAPTIALAREENSGSNGASVSAHATPTLTGTGEPGTEIRVSKSDGSRLGTTTVQADGTWRLTVQEILHPGLYGLTAIAFDGVNASPVSSPLTLTVGTGQPNDPILGFRQAVGAAFGFMRSSTPELFGWVSEPFKTVLIFSGPTAVGTARSDENGEFTVRMLTSLGEGAHRLRVMVDSVSSAEVVIVVDRTPPAAPTLSLSILQDVDSAGQVTSVLPRLSGLAEGLSIVRVYDLQTGTLRGTTTAQSGGAWDMRLDVPLTGGVHQLVAIATDRAGNSGPPSQVRSISVAAVDLSAGNDVRGLGGTVFGHAGNDVFTTFGSARDLLDGGSGDDVLSGGGGADQLFGGLGNDTASYATSPAGVTVSLFTGLGSGGDAEGDKLFGIENLLGSALNDRLTGNAIDNILNGNGGSDRLEGGAGNDTYFAVSPGSVVIDDASGSADRIRVASLSNILTSVRSGNDLLLTLSGGTSITVAGHFGPTGQVEFLSDGATTVVLATGTVGGDAGGILSGTDGNDVLDGRGGDDILFGMNGHDRLLGGTGNDRLVGGEGADVLKGGTGADRMEGGTGHDYYEVDDAGDVVIEAADEGYDTVASGISLQLADNVEKLVLTGTADIDGTGNALDNRIVGNSGRNVLAGGLGNDVLTGGAGADRFVIARDGSLDALTDFSPNLGDTIQFDRASFGIPSGAAVSSYVTLAAAAPDRAHGYILANATGVFWDADGAGGSAPVRIATFTTAPTGLTLSSFSFN